MKKLHITKLDGGTADTQSQHNHSTLKKIVANGVSQQIIKRHDGNYLNVDYEAIHSMDL